ncbi:MAG TPA: LacI family DNA-binding transcriptional regulator, partial [Sphingomicrobium sp.]|nr:LacI family DNA-binding transcriptional regulator [Sphingomicrobium sp.]
MTQRRPTSFDIAALAGVSQPTVSRALSGNPSVSEETRARVLAAAEQLHYTVDKNASGLRRRQSRTLALLFFEEWSPEGALINPFYL